MRRQTKERAEGGVVAVGNSMEERIAFITEQFRNFPGKKYTIKSLSAAIGAPDREGRSAVKEILEGLMSQGVIEPFGSGKFQLNVSSLDKLVGVVDMVSSGSMYIKIEGQEKDVFVSQRSSLNALHGDTVEVIVLRVSRSGVPEGEVVRVVERTKKNFVGVLEMSPNFAFVRVDSRKVPQDVYIHLDKNHEYHNGQKVLIHIMDWPVGSKSPIGKILDVFGNVGENDAEMHAILAEYDLPYKFDPDIERAADAIPDVISPEEIAKRRDFRNITTFTIDPADAKDFDDALSIRKVEKGWEVGVHIADVTHYVREGEVVDTEAVDRATSVYLVDRTIPMLPEKLSNELCSLRPNEEKLAFSAVFVLDDDANLIDEWFGRTIICSDRRFTYAEAQDIIEGAEGELKEEVLTLNSLARKIRAERFKHGSVGFEREEVKFDLDENGKPIGVTFKEQKESNQLIEEFMLLANKKVAEFVGKKRGAGANAERTFIYRVHDKPNVDKLASFRSFIMRFGYNFQADQGKAIAKEMNRLMEQIKGRVEENVISTLAIRTMAKAYYTTDNIGHYGLAFDFYTHFTSPIRRYPDMMVHRLLDHYLSGGKSPDKEPYEALCEHSSQMEVRASEAERASIKYKMVEFMLDKLGEEFDAHLSGVTEWGVYAELDDTHIEGMVSLRDMQDDFYQFDPENYCVVGQTLGKVLTLGDKVRIKVLRADLARKQLDFELVATYDVQSGDIIPIEKREMGNRPRRDRDSKSVDKIVSKELSKRTAKKLKSDVPAEFVDVASHKSRKAKKH